MGIRRNQQKNKKMSRHELMAKTQRADMVRRVPKTRRGRAGRGR